MRPLGLRAEQELTFTTEAAELAEESLCSFSAIAAVSAVKLAWDHDSQDEHRARGRHHDASRQHRLVGARGAADESAADTGEPACAKPTMISAARAAAQSPSQRTYANPIDIDYKYNFEQHNEGISYRSGADPVIVVQRGEYYLFETIGEGYWHSRDLGTWEHITPSRWPLTDIVAPAVLSVRDTIYLLPSTTRPLRASARTPTSLRPATTTSFGCRRLASMPVS